jgi:formylglycine-generating enzyme required for sulfatase activity
MVSIPTGSFQMGSPETEADSSSNERPVHTVTLSAFKMGKYEVTQGQWESVMGNNPSYFSENPDDEGENGWKKLPVEQVSWYDVLVFCNKLSIQEGLTPAYSISDNTDPGQWGTVPTSSDITWNAVACDWTANGYRLPTEAEWEYAAKGGNGSPYNYIYAGSNTVDDVAWYETNSDGKTHEVGTKAANGLGLYDMSGNVYEWCWDWYASTYPGEAQTNPTGASSGTGRVLRGGSWLNPARGARSALRSYAGPQYRAINLGFRLVRPAQ